jgi:hypothetical protein
MISLRTDMKKTHVILELTLPLVSPRKIGLILDLPVRIILGDGLMKRIRIFLPLAVFIFSVMASGQSTKSSLDGRESLTEQPQQSAVPRPAASRSEEMLERWNDIGNKLIAVAQDFPEDKYDYKLQKDERTFALNLLHAAALDFVLLRRISGSNLGPDFGEGDNPSRDQFKTKADVAKFVKEAIADGAQVIQQQGDAGLDNSSKFFGNRLAHNSSIWTFAIEHSGEHYGQLVVYYRANNLVPPASRPR